MEYSTLTINLLTAFLIVILTLVFANIFNNIIKHVLKGLDLNQIIHKQLKMKVQLEETISSAVKYIIYLIGLIAVLNQLGISSKILWIIFAIILVIILIFIILSLKDVIPNIFSGFYIKKTKKIKIGDTIKVKGIEGRVISINLLETKIETKNKESVFIPNTILTKEQITKI